MRNATTALWVRASSRLRDARELGTERGLTTTEVAVLTFVLVAIAVAVGALLYNFASETIDNAPTPEIPDFSE